MDAGSKQIFADLLLKAKTPRIVLLIPFNDNANAFEIKLKLFKLKKNNFIFIQEFIGKLH